ncbi:MAG: hypothetical protein ACREYA_16325 [Cupriavidus necator]
MKALSRLNLKQVALLCATLLTSVSIHAASPAQPDAASNTAAPLGLELGKARCSRLAPPQNHARTGKSEWAGGDAVELRHLERFHLPGLTRVILNCDAQDTVALITMTFERPALDEVRKKLDERYASLRKTEGAAENGYAEWAAANGSLELLYGRDSKHFTVAYWARGAKARYFSYSGTDNKKPAAATPASQPQPAPL